MFASNETIQNFNNDMKIADEIILQRLFYSVISNESTPDYIFPIWMVNYLKMTIIMNLSLCKKNNQIRFSSIVFNKLPADHSNVKQRGFKRADFGNCAELYSEILLP